ncbi:MAG TPA: hypothetical protein VIK39_06450 [Candidatus Angelobacter sp.]
MKWIYVILGTIIIGLLLGGLWWRQAYHAKYGHGKDDACVDSTTINFNKNAIKFDNKLDLRINLHRSFDKTLRLPTPTPIPIPPGVLLSLNLMEALLRGLQCNAVPFAISSNQILPYPSPTSNPTPSTSISTLLPPPCEGKPIIIEPGDLPKEKLSTVAQMSGSIGRLEIRNTTSDTNVSPVMLGTGFMIGTGVFATTCHVVAPLLKAHPDLQLDGTEELIIDFETTRHSSDKSKEFAVTGFLGCSQKHGFDIALLDLCEKSDKGDADACKPRPSVKGLKIRSVSDSLTLPSPLTLLDGSPEDINQIKKDLSVIVGYPDLEHFINADKRTIFAPYIPEDQNYGKFLSIDGVESEDECDKDLGIVLDTVTTTVGESGSVVIDLHEPVLSGNAALSKEGWMMAEDNRAPVVVGVHTCCSAFFEDGYGTPPYADRACAQLRRTFHNQDIPTWAILKDPDLCPLLEKRGTSVAKYKDGNPYKLVCSKIIASAN